MSSDLRVVRGEPAPRRAELLMVSLLEAHRRSRKLLLPRERILIGRAATGALELTDPHSPRTLAYLTPVATGWVIENGPKTRMVVQHNEKLAVVRANPLGMAALQPGKNRVIWPELDVEVRLNAELLDGRPKGIAECRLDPRRLAGSSFGTLGVLGRTELNVYRPRTEVIQDEVMHTMAVLYRHLLEESAAPANLLEAAAGQLDKTPAAVKQAAKGLMERINDRRAALGTNRITTLEQLGHYLVVTSRLLRQDDLHYYRRLDHRLAPPREYEARMKVREWRPGREDPPQAGADPDRR